MPAAVKVCEPDHELVLGDAGYSNEPSSNLTLWFPVVLLHVTLSPWVTATVAGEN